MVPGRRRTRRAKKTTIKSPAIRKAIRQGKAKRAPRGMSLGAAGAKKKLRQEFQRLMKALSGGKKE